MAAALVGGCSLVAPGDDYFVSGGAGGSGGAPPTDDGPCTPAPPCTDAAGPATRVVGPAEAADLHSIVLEAAAGSVIELEDGTYTLNGPLVFARDDVTLRSKSGDAAAVTIDGQGYPGAIQIDASRVTLSAITVLNLGGGGLGSIGVAVAPSGGRRLLGIRLCGVELRNAGAEAFVSVRRTGGGVADCGRVERGRFELDVTAAGLCADPPSAALPSAITVAGGRGWVVTGSAFSGFTCTPLDPRAPICPNPPFAVRFDQGARDSTVENNCILGAARGIAFGVQEFSDERRVYSDAPYDGAPLSHIDGLIRNNVILGGGCYDTGIELNWTRQPRVFHNTVLADGYIAYRAIDARFDVSQTTVWNNVVDPSGVNTREGGQMDAQANVSVAQADFATVFADAASYDFHLRPRAATLVDSGAPLPTADDGGLDLDGDPHEAQSPDVGADELGTPAADPLTPCQLIAPG